ncbi:hypothetical protein [Faecalibacter bovis]|uniref:DUF4367 domain-containing protein n=1 Tax=Faecalibacter bovis TaxID=2898187 RepID=A0ABX7XAP2_9FLAO|nr:hypothetical protein [Faecalibacter bovis]QTV04965.1 hypothetical protein J9309_09210 [Faecalibacter bovis]
MKKYLPILFILFTCIANAQFIKEENKANVIAYWEKGEEYNYKQLEKEYKINKNDTVITKDKKFDVKIKIVDQDSTSYTIHWENTPDLSDYPPQLAQLVANHKVGNFVFKYKTDEFGSFVELLNIDEIVDFNKRAMDMMLESITDKKVRKEVEDASKLLMQNEEVITQFAVNKINTFHFFYGHSLELGKPHEYEFENINPITKNRILYKQLVELESVDEEDKTYSLYTETIPDENNLIGEIKSTLETIISKEVKEMDQIKNFDYISKIFQVTHDSGVIFYQMKRDFIEADNQEIIKEIEFILK